MPQMVYAPGVKVYVSTSKHGVIDISDDLVSGTMIRRSDGVSTFQFQIQNPFRKYDQVFTPNDRISVQMKRLTWLQVYTGYLNSVPLLAAWPRVVNVTSSCSLKRLQYWTWDAEAQATQTMIDQALTDAGNDPSVTDAGMTNVILSILKKVVGWPESKVHIAQIPPNWYKVVEKLAVQLSAQLAPADAAARTLFNQQVGTSSIAGESGSVGAVLSGSYGGVTYTAQALSNAEEIYNVGVSMGETTSTITVALMAAIQESTLGTNPGIMVPDQYGSVGIFQMQPGAYWGTLAQCTDVASAAQRWFQEWDKKVGPAGAAKMSLDQQAQAVEVSAFPNAYAPHQAAASAMVSAMTTASGGASTSLVSNPAGASSGQQLAQLAVNFCLQYPTIPYTEQYAGTQEAILAADPPPGLDCSSFIQAMYLRALGALYGLPRTAADQAAFCTSVSVTQALQTPGALLFKVTSSAGIGHVEMSLGDGINTIGAHYSGAKPHEVGENSAVPASYWDSGGFLPRISYTTTGTAGGGGVVQTGTSTSGNGDLAAPILTTADQAAGYDANDPIDKLFGDSAWLPISTAQNDPQYALAQMLNGPRALLNDTPLLPYLKNVFGSAMRSFCSAPNGDLIAWYPDYYGMWGQSPAMVIEPIECQDFEVDWSDDYMVTHQFVVNSPMGGNVFDPAAGQVSSLSITDDLAVFTTGVVTIDLPAVWSALFGMDLTDAQAASFASWIKGRFGARPDYQQMPGLVGPKAELFAAIFLFLRQYAYQYSASVPLSWMPELYPGMLLQIPAFDFQGYVTTVTHTFQFGPNGGFSTSVDLAAPARLSKTGASKLLGLPVAGGLA